jgi:hypothetical protein
LLQRQIRMRHDTSDRTASHRHIAQQMLPPPRASWPAHRTQDSRP